MRKKIIQFFVLIPAVLLTSCLDIFKEKETSESAYPTTVQWTLLLNQASFSKPVVLGAFYYTYAFTDNGMEVVKINIEKGEICWRSEEYISNDAFYDMDLLYSNGYLYAKYDYDESLYCYDDRTGTLAARLEFDFPLTCNSSAICYESYIYWPTCTMGGNDGIVRFDTRKIDFSKNTEKPQKIEAELFYRNTNQCSPINENLIENNGIIYYLTESVEQQPDPTNYVGSLNALTGEVIWEHKAGIPGGASNGMYIVNNRLYAMDWQLGCYELETGSTIFENVQTKEDQQHEVYVGTNLFTQGVTYYNGCFYYTGATTQLTFSVRPEEFCKNVICVSAKDGKYVWGDLPPDSASLSSIPIVIDDKAYFFCSNNVGLRVYNAKTGELLGSNAMFRTDSMGIPVLYNDTIIFYNKTDGCLTCFNVE